MAPSLRVLALACVSLGASLPQSAEREVCPWCKGDPDLMERAGIVSHGPIPIGAEDSEAILRELPARQWVFIETAHLRWASALGACNVEMKDRKRVAEELARLKALLPTVPSEAKKLDPFLRLHLFAMKGEELYARFQALLRVEDADFPESRTAEGPFMGNGRFLGEKDKFEVVIHSTRISHNQFTREFSGEQVVDSLRWHFKEQHKMLASVPAEDPDLKTDEWLWPHCVHCLSHLFFCAYKHYSYAPPVWLDEGLALCMEKEAEPASTTNEGEEGSKPDVRGPKDWFVAARKMVAADDHWRLAQLLAVQETGELDEAAKISCWSMVRFLIDAQGEPFARMLGGIKGQLDEAGYPTNRDLPGLQRSLLKELWGWTPHAFDQAWTAWVQQTK